MTLCVVWREKSQIHFASDSRITFPGGALFDFAIKISKISTEIDKLDQTTGVVERFFDRDIGICVAGSTVNAFLLRDSITDQLQGTFLREPDFETLANRAFRQYSRISKHLCEVLASNKGQAEVAISGYCPLKKQSLAFLMSPVSQGENDYVLKPIHLRDGESFFFGSGAMAARNLVSVNCIGAGEFTSCHAFGAITQIIANPNIPSVGGHVRMSSFDIEDGFRSFWVSQEAKEWFDPPLREVRQRLIE